MSEAFKKGMECFSKKSSVVSEEYTHGVPLPLNR